MARGKAPRLPTRTLITIGVLALVVRALTSQPTLTFAVDQLSARLHDELGLTLVVGHVEADATSARLTLGPVVVQGQDGSVLFSAARVEAEIAPLKFFERRVRVEHLTLTSPRVHLHVVDGAIAGIVLPEGSASDDPLLPVDIADFRLHDGALDVLVESSGHTVAHAALEGLEARLNGRAEREHRLKFTVRSGALERPRPDGRGMDRLESDAFGGRVAVIGDGLLAPEQVILSDVTLAAADTEVTVGGTIDIGARGVVPAFRFDVAGTSVLGTALRYAHLPVEVDGRATIAAHVSAFAGLRQLAVGAEVNVLDVRAADMTLGDVRARVLVDELGAVVEAGSWDIGDTRVRATATVAFDDALTTTVHATGEAFSIYALLTALGSPGAWADTHIDGTIDLAGTLQPLLLTGQGGGAFRDVFVAGEDVRRVKREDMMLVAQHPIAATGVDIRVDDEGLTFTGDVDDGITHGHGTFQIFYDVTRGLFIDVHAEPVGFASIGGAIGSLHYTGTGKGHVHVEGPQSHLVLTAQADLEDFALEGYAFGHTAGDIRLEGDALDFTGLVAVKEDNTRIAGDVTLNFGEQRAPNGAPLEAPLLSLDLKADPARAEVLRRIVPKEATAGVLAFLRDDLDMEGPVVLHVAAQGAVGDGNFDHVTGAGELELLAAARTEQAGGGATLLGQHLVGHGRFHLDPERFHIDDLDATLAQGHARFTLAVGRDAGEMAGHVNVTAAALAGLDALTGTSRPFFGTFDVDADVGGDARDPQLDGRARLHGAAYGKIPIGDADMALLHKGRILTLSGACLTGRAQGVVHTETRAPFVYDATLQVKDGGLAPLLPPDLLPKSVAIDLRGTVEVGGALKTFRQSRGVATLPALALRAKGLRFTNSAPVVAHFFGTRLTFDALDLVTAAKDTLALRGLLADDAVDLQASGAGGLQILDALLDRAPQARGRFSFELGFTGDLDRLRMAGQGYVSDGSVALGPDLPALTDIGASIAFRGQNVVVERFTARANGAPVEAQGSVTVDGLTPRFWDLEGRYTKLHARYPEWLDTTTSGRLALRGEAELPTLSGEIQVHSARYDDDINWERLLPDLRRKTTSLARIDTGDEDVRFDVHVIANRGLVVENNVLDMEAKGDFFVVGTDERPGLKGGLQLLRGNATFRGNRYRISRGTVDFTDTSRINPVLDLEADTRVHDYEVFAHVTGPAQAPTIDLMSRPDLSEQDILSLLTLGFTQWEVRDASGSAGAASLEVVSAYTGLDQELRRILPDVVQRSKLLTLDELRLTSAFSSRAGASVPALALGMQVSPGVWGLDGSRLRLQSTLLDVSGNGTEQKVEWEKHFENNVRLRLVWTSADDGSCPACQKQWGDVGGDLWYRWEF